jgi:predicted Zn-dependent protease
MIKKILPIVLIVLLAVACSRNTITGRSQLTLVPESQVQSLAISQYKDFLNKNKVIPNNSKDQEMVNRVGNKIAFAIDKYYKEHGMPNALKGYQWEFNLIENKEVNAWCMPGGKVVCYTGLLPITLNETSLAIVLGHEITHAVAGHGRERMSEQLLAQGLGIVGDIALGSNPETVTIFNQVYMPSAQVGVLLPNSRKQENEADHYGLIFAAMAGYNPEDAIPFWKRMAAMGGEKPPIFLSDHPADEERIKNLQVLMPEAIKYYHSAISK